MDIAVPALPALASAGPGLKKVHDPGRVTGTSHGRCYYQDKVEDALNPAVHSNQPYTDATASADGYSWSYETNSSGYAVIYLNGPPAGAPVTVKVAAATCTATWT